MSHLSFHTLEVVGHGSETQLQVGEISGPRSSDAQCVLPEIVVNKISRPIYLQI